MDTETIHQIGKDWPFEKRKGGERLSHKKKKRNKLKIKAKNEYETEKNSSNSEK